MSATTTSYTFSHPVGDIVCVRASTFPVVVAQFSYPCDLSSVGKAIERELSVPILDRHGIYILTLADSYYVGEVHGDSRSIGQRIRDHIKDIPGIRKITVATTYPPMESTQPRDLESVLIEQVMESGLAGEDGLAKIVNVRTEHRKVRDESLRRSNYQIASFIWDIFTSLSARDFVEMYRNKQEYERRSAEQLVSTNTERSSTRRGRNSHFVSAMDIEGHKVLNARIFNMGVAVRRDVIPVSYKRRRVLLPQYAKSALYAYLFEGKTLMESEREIGVEGERGFFMAATLAYYRIETNGDAAGFLDNVGCSPEQARQLIEELVDANSSPTPPIEGEVEDEQTKAPAPSKEVAGGLEELLATNEDEFPKSPLKVRKPKGAFSEFVTTQDIANHHVGAARLFDMFPQIRRDDIPAAYRTSRRVFKPNFARTALFAYLYHGSGVNEIERDLGIEDQRGYFAASTLNYYRIDSGSAARGALRKNGIGADKAKELIDELVNRYAQPDRDD